MTQGKKLHQPLAIDDTQLDEVCGGAVDDGCIKAPPIGAPPFNPWKPPPIRI